MLEVELDVFAPADAPDGGYESDGGVWADHRATPWLERCRTSRARVSTWTVAAILGGDGPMTEPLIASGEQVELASGDMRLVVVTMGGGMRQLTYGDWQV